MADEGDHKEAKAGPGKPGLTRGQIATAGVAVGIGSAAIVAALLYSGRPKKPGRKE